MKRIFCKFLLAAIFLNGLATIARADALDNWTASQVSTNPIGFLGFELLGVTYGNGRYVAVGQYASDNNAAVETSENGVNWTMRSQHDYSISDLYDVTYANGTFVAVGWDSFGGANIYHSTNGINWASHTTKISNFNGVTFGGGLFVAVGDGQLLNGAGTTNRNIYTSPDGITWTPRNSGSPVGDVRNINDVAYGAGQFVAVDGSGYFYTSSTGTTWTRSFNNNAGGRVSFCNGLFIVPSGAGTNLVSPDGLAWSLLTNTTASTFGRVIYANGLYAALSGTNVFTSTNGTNWFLHILHASTNASLLDIAFGNRNIVAVGYKYPPSPMLPAAYVSDPLVDAGMNSVFPPQLKISGIQGRSYRIDYLNGLQPSNGWQTLTTFSLTNSPLLWTDTTATNMQRFYRAVLLP